MRRREFLGTLATVVVARPKMVTGWDPGTSKAIGYFAGPGRSFPIRTPQDVRMAAMLVHKSSCPAKTKALVSETARLMGPEFVAALPKGW